MDGLRYAPHKFMKYILSVNNCTPECKDMKTMSKKLRTRYAKLRIKRRALVRQGKSTEEIDAVMEQLGTDRKELATSIIGQRKFETQSWLARDRSIATRFQECAKRYLEVQGGLCNQESQPKPALRSRS
jgi:hypothetical protein